MTALPEYTPELAATLRAEAGFTQAQMAEAVGYTAAQNWSAVERGERAPSRSTWLIALIVAGRHPQFVRRQDAQRSRSGAEHQGPAAAD